MPGYRRYYQGKLGVPGYEELAMGAVATGGVRVLNDQIVDRLGIPDHLIDAVAAREQQELSRRERLYRGGRPPPDVRDRAVILVDDGLATGATMHFKSNDGERRTAISRRDH